jgi:uncharacterized protein (DUF342 family)
MSKDQDGYVELELNNDRTQAMATIHPPKGGGRAVTPQDVMECLRQRGVVYGYRDSDIQRACHFALQKGVKADRIIVAQGTLPQEGTNGQILWKVDYEKLARPLPKRPDGLLDYFALEEERLVVAGQPLATLTPARPGTPGRTLTAPIREVLPNPVQEAALIAETGVRVSEDRMNYFAAVDGFAEIHGCHLYVHAYKKIHDSLQPAEYRFSGGVILMGDLKAAHLRAEGTVAVQGAVAGGEIRARGDVFLTRAARARVIAEGNVYVQGLLLHCDIISRKKIIALEEAAIIGGQLYALEGLVAVTLGSPDQKPTLAQVGVDHLCQIRMKEVEEEIAGCEAKIWKIAQALRPLQTGGADPMPAAKRQMVQQLVQQRRALEAHVGELHSERRTLLLGAKSRVEAQITVTGTVYPGVSLAVQNAALTVRAPQTRVVFVPDKSGHDLIPHPLPESRAA